MKGICLIWSRGRLFSPSLSCRDKVSESIAEPSPAGISEPRAEISWCIVMVQRSGKASRGTAVGCIFVSFFSHFDIKAGKSPEDIVGKEAFHSCPLSCPC